jgi:hypothetical protein
LHALGLAIGSLEKNIELAMVGIAEAGGALGIGAAAF